MATPATVEGIQQMGPGALKFYREQLMGGALAKDLAAEVVVPEKHKDSKPALPLAEEAWRRNGTGASDGAPSEYTGRSGSMPRTEGFASSACGSAGPCGARG